MVDTKRLLLNNRTHKIQQIGKDATLVSDFSFIGEGKYFSYTSYENRDKGPTIIYVHDINNNNDILVRKYNGLLTCYGFLEDGKSYIYEKQEKKGEDSQNTPTLLYKQDVDDNWHPKGDPEIITPAEFRNQDPSYIFSPSFQKIAITISVPTWNSINAKKLYVYDIKTKKLHRINEEGLHFRNLIFFQDEKKLALITHSPSDARNLTQKHLNPKMPPRIRVINIETKEEDTFLVDDVWQILCWAPDNKSLLLLKQNKTVRELCYLDLKTKKLTALKNYLPIIFNPKISSNGKYIAYSGEDFYHPFEIYISSLENFNPKQASLFQKRNEELKKIKTEIVKWKSSDGLEIEGILVYPQEYKQGRKVPLIVCVHGGPAAIMSQQFLGDKWSGHYSPAVFASQGYATLFPNFRGSLGYGFHFQNLNYQDLGGGDYKDIIAGIKYLTDRGIADPEKLFIEGHSYGGFMAAWAVAHTDLFKSAVMSAGIVDWIPYISSVNVSTEMESLLGCYFWDNYKLYREVSPISYVQNISTPTLLIHGDEDKNVPSFQSRELHYALKNRGVPTYLIVYKGESHGFIMPTSIIDSMNKTLSWFKKYK